MEVKTEQRSWFDDCTELKNLGYQLAIIESSKQDPAFSLAVSDRAMTIIRKYIGAGANQMEAIKWYHYGYENGIHDWNYGDHRQFVFNHTTGEITSKKILKIAEPADTKRFRIVVIF